ncbi:MAG: PA2779 family protein [Pseudomonadota bacterium]
MTTSRWRRTAVVVLTVSVLNLGMLSAAQAGIVSTSAIVRTDRDVNLASIRSQLDRSEVRAQMEKMGVDATAVDKRIASLSDQEVAQMATQMQKAPAGEGALVVIGLVFLVLMILEFTGIIDIFKRAP